MTAPVAGVTLHKFSGSFAASPRRWLVRNLIREITRGGSIWGLPGQGKGIVAVMLSICLLYGLKIAEHEVRRVDRVLYLDAEDDEYEFGNRVVSISAGLEVLLGHSVPAPSPDQLVYFKVSVDDFTDPSAREFLRKAILAEKAQVVFYDALQSLFGGDHNQGKVGGDIWGWIQQTAAAGSHTPLALDHSGWAGNHEAGTVQKRGRVGQSIQVQKRADGVNTDDNSQWQIVDLYIRKSNYQVSSGDLPALSLKFTFTKEPDLIDAVCESEPEDAIGPVLIEYVEPPAPREATIARIIEILERDGPTTEEALAAQLGMTKDAVRQAIKRSPVAAECIEVTKARNPKTFGLRASEPDGADA